MNVSCERRTNNEVKHTFKSTVRHIPYNDEGMDIMRSVTYWQISWKPNRFEPIRVRN